MSHRNARLTVHGRRLLVHRVREGMPVAHVAKAMGDLASVRASLGRPLRRRGRRRPATTARRVRIRCRPGPAPRSKQRCSHARREHRRGPGLARTRARGAGADGVADPAPPRRAHDCASCDPLTGEVIRASKTTAVRYERERPGELVHMDVKKIGRIPDGGGWRAHGREIGQHATKDGRKIGYDYVHSVVDDHSRLAYSEILADERADTCAEFFARAVDYFAAHGITHRTTDDRQRLELPPRAPPAPAARPSSRITHKFIEPHCPWQNGKVERFNRTLASRMGLPAGVHQQRRTRRRPGTLARPLQHSTTPHRPRQANHPSADSSPT